jgi:tetratricopeptide (TPR) repeat protein
VTDPGGPAETLRRELTAIARLGRTAPAAALARCEALLQAHPRLVAARCLAGHLLRRLGRVDEARRAIESALALDPAAPPALSEAAQLAALAGHWPAARRHLRRLLERRDRDAEAWFNLGLAEERLTRFPEAIAAYERALALAPARPNEIRTRLAVVLTANGRHERATALLREVLNEDPDNAEAHYGLGLLAASAGDATGARAAFRRAVGLRPDFAEAWQQLLESRSFERADDPELQAVASLLERDATRGEGEIRLRFALAKALDDLDDSAAAAAEYRRANALKRAGAPAFDRAACTREFEALAAARGAPPTLRPGPPPTPVFIVGLPRAGTTLLDQLLTAHSDAAGVGEAPWFDQALAGRGAADWRSLDDAARAALTARCRGWLREPGGRVVTNKFPANFRHLPLILDLLPDARILHVVRDPRDTALSIWRQDFPFANAWANDLLDIAAYVNGYRGLMAAYGETCGAALLDVHYELLVADPRPVMAGVLDFVGLPWDDACLDPTGNERRVDTLSRWQVRRPVYRDAVGGWRRYEDALAPLLAALADFDAPQP